LVRLLSAGQLMVLFLSGRATWVIWVIWRP
jgi:hypothetical protein